MIPPEPDMPHDSSTPPPASLPSSEEAWQLLENLPLPVLIASLHENARVIFLNRQFTATFGYTQDDIPTKEDWARLAYPDAAYRSKVFDKWDKAVARAIAKQGGVEAMEFKVTAKDGSLRDILFNATVLGDTLQVTLTDLTARRKAERELVSARKKLERTAYEVTENIPVGTYTMVLPPDGTMAKFSFMSSRFLELCGLERRAAEENPFNAFACVHPEDHDEWVRKNTECFEKKIPFSEECRVVANGVTRWIHAESVPREHPDGSMVWEGVLTDITRRKTAEAELAASEARLRSILNNIPIPIALNDAREDGPITFLNETFTRAFGYTLDDIPTVEAWARLAYPDGEYRAKTFGIWNALVDEAARTDGIVPPMEVHIMAKNGSRRDVIISAALLDDMLLVAFVDDTARRKAEENLRSAQEKLQRTAYELTGNIPVGTYVLEFDPGGTPRFTFISERWLAMLDLRREDVLADPSLAFNAVHPDERDAFNRLNAEVFAEKKPFFWEGRIVVHGRTRWVSIESIPRNHPTGGTIWEGVMIDITDRKTAEAELAALREQERKKEALLRDDLERKLRTSLAAAVAAHEINQPLSRILLASELVLQSQQTSSGHDPKLSGFLRELATEARSVVSTIETMKSLIRNTETAHAPLDLRKIVDAALLYAGPFARQAEARISFHRPARPIRMEGDADQLQIALNNLLRNAIESLAGTPPQSQRDIRVCLRSLKHHLELVVEDSGPGYLPPDPDNTLFNSTKPQGAGLGLFIVQTTMENHRGRLETDRSPLGGAAFRMVFPRGKAQIQTPPAAQ